jgi:hypothetical protein
MSRVLVGNSCVTVSRITVWTLGSLGRLKSGRDPESPRKTRLTAVSFGILYATGWFGTRSALSEVMARGAFDERIF